MLRVVGYVRVSTAEQAAEGVSLDAQRLKLALYCGLHDLHLVAIDADEGLSGSTLRRPGLEEALGQLDRGEADGLLVAKLDRLTRSVRDLGALLDGYFGPDGRHQLLSVADSIDTRTAGGRLMLNVLMSVAQWERETIVDRTRDAVRHKRSLRERIGQVPYGSRLDPDGRTLLVAEDELAALARLVELHAHGRSLRAVADALTAEGHPTKSGRPWSASTVRSLLQRGEAARAQAPP